VQLDLRFEARNLVKFGENFKGWDNDIVIFPKLVKEFPPIDKHVLVESFLDGIPILDYARAHEEDRERLNTMCNRAIKAVCKMIFLDNFLHGRLLLSSLLGACLVSILLNLSLLS
jgi:aarF domain-containing kinase